MRLNSWYLATNLQLFLLGLRHRQMTEGGLPLKGCIRALIGPKTKVGSGR